MKKRGTITPMLLTRTSEEELLRAIRRKCLDCCCGSKKMVKHCKTDDCSLYPYRNCFAMVQVSLLEEN